MVTVFRFAIVFLTLFTGPLYAFSVSELNRDMAEPFHDVFVSNPSNPTSWSTAEYLHIGKLQEIKQSEAITGHVLQIAANSDALLEDLEKAEEEEKAIEAENQALRKRVNELEKEVQSLQSKREELNKKLNE